MTNNKDNDKEYIGRRDPLTAKIIEACYKAHNELGPGFVERIYANALKIVFDKIKIRYETEKEFSVKYENQYIGKFRVDFLIEDKVIVEIKSVEGIMPKIFESQIILYLKASGLKVGLLVNFGNRSCIVRRLMM
jgi:GxxExxY protein